MNNYRKTLIPVIVGRFLTDNYRCATVACFFAQIPEKMYTAASVPLKSFHHA